MKLRYSQTSPYVRKVMVAAIEVGLEGQIEVVPTDPWDPETDLPDDNPLGKVPTLVTEDGMTIVDSSVISEYLDSLHDGRPLFPLAGEARWQVLGDGILAAYQLRRVEDKIHEKHMQSAGWIARQKRTVERRWQRWNAKRRQSAKALSPSDTSASVAPSAISTCAFTRTIGGRHIRPWRHGMRTSPNVRPWRRRRQEAENGSQDTCRNSGVQNR